MALFKYVKVALADAAHLLDPVHSPREVFLRISEEAARLLDVDDAAMPDVPAARVAEAPVDSETERLRRTVAELTALNTQLASAAQADKAAIASQFSALNDAIASLRAEAKPAVDYGAAYKAAATTPAVPAPAPAPVAPPVTGAPPVTT